MTKKKNFSEGFNLMSSSDSVKFENNDDDAHARGSSWSKVELAVYSTKHELIHITQMKYFSYFSEAYLL